MATGGSDQSLKDGHEMFYDWRCSKCEEDDRMSEATSYCKNCNEGYCDSCLKYHNKFTRGHEVLGQGDKADWGEPAPIYDSGVACSEHQSIKDGHEMFYDWRCSKCEEDDLMSEATSYCKNCNEGFCDSCLKSHNKFLRDHEVLGQGDTADWGEPAPDLMRLDRTTSFGKCVSMEKGGKGVPFAKGPEVESFSNRHVSLSGAMNLVQRSRDPVHVTPGGRQQLIYPDRVTNVEKCVKLEYKKVDKQYIERRIDQYTDVVKSLTSREKQILENIVSLVDMDINGRSGIITVKGTRHHVSMAISELQDLLRKIQKGRQRPEEADILYKQFYEELTLVESKLVKCDKVFQGMIENEKGDKSSQIRVVRKEISKSGGADLPADWVPMEGDENLKILPIKPSDQKYKDLEKTFLQEVNNGRYTHRTQFRLNTIKIKKIEKIQNKALYQQYMAKKKQMKNQKPNLPAYMPIERDLWHGTKPDAASDIKRYGFNRSYCGVNGVWWGQGVYFAKDASYSVRGWLSGADQAKPGQTATGFVFSVKALTGQYCKGDPNMRYLHPIDPNRPDLLYDSAVDNPKDPFEFVFFTDTQAYPEYLIEFTATVK